MPTPLPITSDSILGCILGGALGDAAGSSFENGGDGAIWQITDDTQLTLATCEALSRGEVEPAAIAAEMLRWFRARRLRGLGSSTLKALRDLEAGCHWALAGAQGERAAGNGAAMRIAPLAFCCDADTASGRQLIRDVCRITHRHEEAYVGALATVLAIRNAPVVLPDSVVRDRLRLLVDVATIAEAADRVGRSGYVAESVPLALFAARQCPRLGFTEMLHQLIEAGGDTDTIASLAGQVAGAALGLSGLPPDLLDRLPERALITQIAHRFAAHVTGDGAI